MQHTSCFKQNRKLIFEKKYIYTCKCSGRNSNDSPHFVKFEFTEKAIRLDEILKLDNFGLNKIEGNIFAKHSYKIVVTGKSDERSLKTMV